MKKIIALVLVFGLLFSFSSCSGVDDSPSKESYTASKEESKAASSVESNDTFGLNETAVFKNMKVTATEVKESKGEEYFEPEDGNVLVGIKFVIENISQESQSVSSLLQFNAYADDLALEYSFSAGIAFEKGVDGDVEPGKRIEGWYAVEVPENYKVIDIYFQNDILSSNKTQFTFKK